MTVTTDLFLPTSPTAPPTGSSSGNGASSVGNRPQNTLENDPDRFKKYLAQKTDKTTEETNKQTSGKQISNATDISDTSENVNRPAPPDSDHNTYKADNDPADIQEPESDIQEPENDAENQLIIQPDLNIHTGQNDSTQQKDTTHKASEIPGTTPGTTSGTTIAPPTQTGQPQKDGTAENEKTPVDTDRLQQVTFSQSDNINGITNTEKTDATPQTTNNQNKIPANNPEIPVSEGEKIIKQAASEPSEIIRISSSARENQKSETALSKPPGGQNVVKQNMAEKNIIGQNASNSNAPDSNAPDQNPPDQKVAAQAVPLTDKATPTDVRQTPEATSQQMAAVGSVIQKDMTGNNSVKDSHIKKSDKENNIPVVDEKEQTSPKGKSKRSSQNSATDNGATKTVSAHGSAVTNSQTSLTVKLPFLTESGLNMAATETKAGQPITLQLPPGLLSVQEVGQSSSLNNGLTAAGQIKPPVTPQMITGQIRMAIAKQVSNGQNSFRISLKPAELGQVDIRMDFQAEGRITATVTVENDRTLTLLQRDQAALEKALENAGFGVGSDNLNFTLKKQQQNQEQNELTDAENGEDGENNALSALPGSIISQQQMKMAYSDNILDINI